MPAELSREALRSLLAKGWLTHDGMWFMHCMRAMGMEKANQINQDAIRSMAAVEIKRLRRALGVERVPDLASLGRFLADALEIVGGDFMDFRLEYQEPDRMTAHTLRCFAYEGMLRLGVAEQYQCGIFTRVEAWLHGLGLSFRATPQFSGCLMQSRGSCRREYVLSFSA